MTTVIKVLSLGSFEVMQQDVWVRSYEPDGHGGRGDLVLTHDRALAAQYVDTGHALRVYREQSTTHPWRSDGKANRPLTAYSVEFETDVEADADVVEVEVTAPDPDPDAGGV